MDFLSFLPAWREPVAPWQQPQWTAQVEPLDGEGEVFLVHDFLSAAEVDHVLRRARGQMAQAAARQPPPLPPQQQQQQPFATTALAAWDQRGREIDAVLARIEQRVGNLTGIPPHAREGMPRVTVSRPWSPTASRGALKNLHHDQNGVLDGERLRRKRERRAVTLLVYLSPEEGGGVDGGQTLFPCVTPHAERGQGGEGGEGGVGVEGGEGGESGESGESEGDAEGEEKSSTRGEEGEGGGGPGGGAGGGAGGGGGGARSMAARASLGGKALPSTRTRSRWRNHASARRDSRAAEAPRRAACWSSTSRHRAASCADATPRSSV